MIRVNCIVQGAAGKWFDRVQLRTRFQKRPDHLNLSPEGRAHQRRRAGFDSSLQSRLKRTTVWIGSSFQQKFDNFRVSGERGTTNGVETAHVCGGNVSACPQ